MRPSVVSASFFCGRTCGSRMLVLNGHHYLICGCYGARCVLMSKLLTPLLASLLHHQAKLPCPSFEGPHCGLRPTVLPAFQIILREPPLLVLDRHIKQLCVRWCAWCRVGVRRHDLSFDNDDVSFSGNDVMVCKKSTTLRNVRSSSKVSKPPNFRGRDRVLTRDRVLLTPFLLLKKSVCPTGIPN